MHTWTKAPSGKLPLKALSMSANPLEIVKLGISFKTSDPGVDEGKSIQLKWVLADST